MPRFSLKALLIAMIVLSVLGAAMNTGGSIVRMIVSEMLAMVFLATVILSVRDILHRKPEDRAPEMWLVPIACIALMVWAIAQMVVAV